MSHHDNGLVLLTPYRGTGLHMSAPRWMRRGSLSGLGQLTPSNAQQVVDQSVRTIVGGIGNAVVIMGVGTAALIGLGAWWWKSRRRVRRNRRRRS